MIKAVCKELRASHSRRTVCHILDHQGEIPTFGSMTSPNLALSPDPRLETFRARPDSSQSGDSARAHAQKYYSQRSATHKLRVLRGRFLTCLLCQLISAEFPPASCSETDMISDLWKKTCISSVTRNYPHPNRIFPKNTNTGELRWTREPLGCPNKPGSGNLESSTPGLGDRSDGT